MKLTDEIADAMLLREEAVDLLKAEHLADASAAVFWPPLAVDGELADLIARLVARAGREGKRRAIFWIKGAAGGPTIRVQAEAVEIAAGPG